MSTYKVPSHRRLDKIIAEFKNGLNIFSYYAAFYGYYPLNHRRMEILLKEPFVNCQFVIEKDGSVTDVSVVHTGGHPSLDKEAVRVIKLMPKWKPDLQDGKPVRVRYAVPVNFRLK